MIRYELPIAGILIVALLALGTIPGVAAAKPKPLTPDSPEVKQVVLAKLRQPTPEEIENLKRIIRAMVTAGDDAQKRDRAIKQFLADYIRYHCLLKTTHIEEFRLSREELNRLEQIFSSSKEMMDADRRCKTAARLVVSNGLLDQPDYLIRMLKQTKGRDQAAVAKRLQKVTGQTLGQDVSAWTNWWSRQKVWGKFEQVAPEVGNLIRLKIVGKSLCLDRGHWAEVAKKTDKEELKKRILAGYDIDRRNKQWALKRARDAVEGPDSRLVFTLLALASEEEGVGHRSSGKRRFSFRFGGSGGAFKGVFSHRDETVRITLEERLGPRRRLEVWDSGTAALRILLTSLADGSVLMIHQRPNGNFSVGQADAGGSISFREDSFASFCRKHRRYADDQVFSRLRRLGVSLPALPEVSSAPATKGRPAVPPADSGKAEWKTGLLQDISADVGRLIGLTVSRGGLCLDRTHWQRRLKAQDLEKLRAEEKKIWGFLPPYKTTDERRIFQKWPDEFRKQAFGGVCVMRLLHRACMQHQPSGGGGSGAGAGGDSVEMDFHISRALRAKLRLGHEWTRIFLSEDSSPGREIEVIDDGHGAMRIQVMGANGEAGLLINQAANGRFSVAEVGGERFFVAGEASFKTFYRKYRRYVDERLFGYLKHLGIVTPLSSSNEVLKDAVLLKLTGPSEQDAREGRRLIKQLDDNRYARRQEASRILTTRFLRYRKVLGEARESKSLSAETKVRLEQIFAKALAVERIEQIITGMGLLEDAGYLVKLMGQAKGANRKAIEARLRNLADKDPGAALRDTPNQPR